MDLQEMEILRNLGNGKMDGQTNERKLLIILKD